VLNVMGIVRIAMLAGREALIQQAGTKPKQLDISLFPTIRSEHGLGEPTMTHWFRPAHP